MTINCTICSRVIDGRSITVGDDNLHAECLSGGLQHTLLAAVEMIAVVTAPVIIVWSG